MGRLRSWLVGEMPPAATGGGYYIAEEATARRRRSSSNEDDAPPPPPRRPCKVIIVGDSGVGKTSLSKLVDVGDSRALPDDFRAFSTIGVDFVATGRGPWGHLRHYSKLHVWDTAGQERFANVTKTYFRGVDVVVLCYSPDAADTFTSLRTRWLPDCLTECPGAPRLVVATKLDLGGSEVSRAAGLEFAHDAGAPWVEVSAQTDAGAAAFLGALRDTVERADCEAGGPQRRASSPRPLSLLEGGGGGGAAEACAC